MLETERLSYCSRSLLILLHVLFGNTPNIADWALVVDIKSILHHSVLGVLLVSLFMIQFILQDGFYRYDFITPV